MSSFRDNINLIKNGEDINETVANRPLQQLQDNALWLRDQVLASVASTSLFIRDVAVKAEVLVGQPVYWDSGLSRYDLALADGTVKENVVGLVYSKSGSTRCDLLILGYQALNIDNALTTAVAATRYWLSASTAGAAFEVYRHSIVYDVA